MKNPNYCIAVALSISCFMLSHTNAEAFDKHKLSVSVGGDWTRCQVNNYQRTSHVSPPYLPEVRSSYRYWNSKRDGLAGSLGFSAGVSYKLSRKLSSELLGFFAHEWGIHYPKPTAKTTGFLDDYAHRMPRSESNAIPNSNLLGSGLGISFYSDIHNIHSLLSAAILFCRANGTIENYRFFSNSTAYEIIKVNYRGWGLGTEISYGLLLNISGNYFLNPNFGYRYISTSRLKDNDGNKYSEHGLDYSGFRIGFDFKYAL